MTDRNGRISYRIIGDIEVWVHRVGPSIIDVTVYDAKTKKQSVTMVTTLLEADLVVSRAVCAELRRQQGEV